MPEVIKFLEKYYFVDSTEKLNKSDRVKLFFDPAFSKLLQQAVIDHQHILAIEDGMLHFVGSVDRGGELTVTEGSPFWYADKQQNPYVMEFPSDTTTDDQKALLHNTIEKPVALLISVAVEKFNQILATTKNKLIVSRLGLWTHLKYGSGDTDAPFPELPDIKDATPNGSDLNYICQVWAGKETYLVKVHFSGSSSSIIEIGADGSSDVTIVV